MPNFDYGNARIRAMKTRLLSRRELDDLAGEESINGLISALTKTAYRKPVESALTRTSGLDCVTESLHNDLLFALGKVGKFFDGQAGEMVAIVLRRYDINNLKGILRGLSKNVKANEIKSTLIPVGELNASLLDELVQSPDPRAAIDLMAMMGLRFAQPLLKLRAEHPGASTVEMELAIDLWFFRETFQYMENLRRAGKVLLEAIQLEADLINLASILRFVNLPEERKLLNEWLHIDKFEELLVGPGKLSFGILTHAARQDTIEATSEIFTDTLYGPALKAGLKKFAESALLSDIEKQLMRFRLVWMSGQIIKDPLGIGVLLGYCALKTNEINNIRWIAHSINMGLNANAIRLELEYPP